MTPRTKSVISNVATGLYLACTLSAVVFTIDLASFEGGPVSMGYAAIFILLMAAASVAVASIVALGRWREKRKFVYLGVIAWPIPFVFTGFVAYAMLFAG